MAKKQRIDHVKAAFEVLHELGGGPMRTKDLIKAVEERGLLGEGKWAHNHLSRRVRESALFDTSVRGHVKLIQFEVPEDIPNVIEEEEEEVTFPGPVLGAMAE